jgi:hypothetical protein
VLEAKDALHQHSLLRRSHGGSAGGWRRAADAASGGASDGAVCGSRGILLLLVLLLLLRLLQSVVQPVLPLFHKICNSSSKAGSSWAVGKTYCCRVDALLG